MSDPQTIIEPTKMTPKEAQLCDNDWVLEVTYNDGTKSIFGNDPTSPKTNYINCVLQAKLRATPESHMIIIKKDGRDFQRWDRDRVVDSNEWHEVDDLGELKTLGKILQLREVSYIQH